MLRIIKLFTVLVMLASLVILPTLQPTRVAAQGTPPTSFADEFDSQTLDPAWQVMAFTGTRYNNMLSPANHVSLTAAPGHLRYYVDPMTYQDGFLNGNGFVSLPPNAWGYVYDPGLELRRTFSGDDWTLEVKAQYNLPSSNHKFFHFRVYFGDGGPGTVFVDFNQWREAVALPAYTELTRMNTYGRASEGQLLESVPLGPFPNDIYYYKLQRAGGVLTALGSADGETWTTKFSRDMGTELNGLTQRVVIVGASFFTPVGSYADYDYVRLTPSSPAGPLKLALLVPLTGPSFLGIPARDGALLAIAQQNASGGILGMTIDPVIEDTACDITTAVDATNKVIGQDGVDYIIGDVCSASSIPMSEITDAAGVIQMSPSATSPQVTVDTDGQVKSHVFRACFVDPFQAAAAARFARDTLSAQKAFIMLDPQNAYAKSLADAFQAEFSRLGTIVGKGVYNSQTTNFSTILAAIAAAKPDVVYLPDFFNIVNLVTQQAKAMDISTPFVGGDGWDSSELDLAAASGGYFTKHFSFEDPRPEVSAFDQAFRSQYGYAPDTIAALAYDAAKLLFQAMGEAGTTEPAVVKTNLAAISYQGVTGSLYYDTSHNGIKSAAVMRVQTDGVHFFALVPPNKPAADLTINYNNGSPDSTFTLTGSDFPPNSAASITINGHAVPGTIAVDGSGGFVFQMSTTEADEGLYLVTASVNPSATARFTLAVTAPLRPPEGSGPVVAVPAGIAYTRFIYLPFIHR